MDTEPVKSEFNAGIAKLMRIDRLHQSVHLARSTNNFKLWIDSLEGLREEICERMDNSLVKQANVFEDKINLFLDGCYPQLLRRNLRDYGAFLAKLEYKFGLSMPDKESPGSVLK